MKASVLQLFYLLKPYRKFIIFGVFLSLIPAVLKVCLPYLLGEAIDRGLTAKNIEAFYWLAGFFLGLQLLVFAFQFITNYFLIRLGLRILVEYRTSLFEKVISYRLNFFDRNPAGKISTRLTNDVNSLQELFSSALVILVGNLVVVFGVVIAMFILDWKLTLVAVSIVPPLLWLIKVFQYRIRRRFGFMRKSLTQLNSLAGESLTGVDDIRGLGVRASNRKEFESLSEKYASRHLAAAREHSIFNPLTYFITSLMGVLILLYGSWAYTNGSMSVGEIAAFLTYASFFAWPLQELAEKYSVLQQALASVDRLVEISEHSPEKNQGEKIFGDFKILKFRGIEFSYAASEQKVLQQLDLQIEQGQKIAFIGETGAGKSTLCSLLMRFYEPTKGQILVDDEDLQNFELSSFRRRVGWVSQDVTLFASSLRENLRFYDQSISDDEIWKVLKLIQLDTWVRGLPRQLDEVLSERASSISSGQRQLISIARALLPKPSLFIFDEATSHVDSQTEYLIQEALESLWQSKEFSNVTGIIIAHRLSTIRRCDKVYVFKEGRIIEEGSFQELMDLRGYAHLLQQKQFREVVHL